jgi:plasmid stabilization system protein ParE
VLAERFIAAFEAAVIRIAQTPQAWPPVGATLRRCLLTTFPYQLIYRIEGDTIRIFALAHQRQRPGYWHKRVPDQ